MKANKKLGLYAQYSKIDGSFTSTTAVKTANDVYKSNEDSQTYMWDLITDNKDFIYNTQDFFTIPKTTKLWDADIANSVNPDMYNCELCDGYFEEEDMDHIAEEEDDDTCSQCKDCAENY